jgi:RNA polymerase sigma-70 factor (ECF subfamily)
VVTVNRAVALAEVEGPQEALEVLERVGAASEAVTHWHLFHAARAELLRRVGDLPGSALAIDDALACPHNDVDDRLLRQRRAALDRSLVGSADAE